DRRSSVVLSYYRLAGPRSVIAVPAVTPLVKVKCFTRIWSLQMLMLQNLRMGFIAELQKIENFAHVAEILPNLQVSDP
uniref:Uncharacterized protein n=1 Tax=Romanomermis culicivorax TaxID=13658 RepID=A0A915JE58_ROMCU